MAKHYMKQLDTIPEKDRLKEGDIKYLNGNLPGFESLTGVNMSKVGDKVPVNGGVPALFLLDEKDPAHPRSLEEAGVEFGSLQFWEMAQKGKLFAYPAGKKEPIQLQVTVDISPRFDVSEPLSTQSDRLASRSYKYPEKEPEYKTLPKEVAQPGRWARFAHFLNRNWYKKEFDAYEKNRAERQQISDENKRKKADYEQRAAEAKQKLDTACRTVSEGIEKHFGAKRTDKVLKEELKAQKTLRDQRAREQAQAKREEAALSAQNATERRKNRITNMISVFGPQPKPLPEMVEARSYKKESFSVLPEIELPEDLKIGDKPVDGDLFAKLALYAQMEPKTAREHYFSQNAPQAEEQLKAEGLSEKEFEEMTIFKMGGHMVSDFVSDFVRVDLDQYFEKGPLPARQRAKEALDEYQQGKKEKLADIIFRAAQFTANSAKEENPGGITTLTHAKLSGELLDLLDEDPELKAAAMDKGLTEEMITACRGMDALRELHDKSLEAEAKILKAAAENRDMTAEENKEQCLKDIFKYRTADAMLKEQSQDRKSKEYSAVKEQLDARNAATQLKKTGQPMPEGMKPIDPLRYADLSTAHYRQKLFKTPPVLTTLAENRERAKEDEELGLEPEPNDLDKIAEMTVKGLNVDPKGLPLDQQNIPLMEMNAKALADKIVKNDGAMGPALVEQQGRIKLALDKAKEEGPAEAELDKSVIYESGEKLL